MKAWSLARVTVWAILFSGVVCAEEVQWKPLLDRAQAALREVLKSEQEFKRIVERDKQKWIELQTEERTLESRLKKIKQMQSQLADQLSADQDSLDRIQESKESWSSQVESLSKKVRSESLR